MHTKSEFRTKEYDLSQFLNGYFHQDAHSADNGISEFLSSTTLTDKKEVLETITKFLQNEVYSVTDKNTFIIDNIATTLEKSPIEWLQEVAHQIEKHLKKN